MPIPTSELAGVPLILTPCVINGEAGRDDYSVMCGERKVGRILKHWGPDGTTPWCWHIQAQSPAPKLRDGRCDTLAEAKAEFRRAFDAYLVQVGPPGVTFSSGD